MTDPRVEINEVVTVRDPLSGYRLLPGASVQVNYRDAGAATVYADETTGSTLSNPLTADSAGRIEGWLAQDSYDLVISHPEAVTYTLRYEAVSALGTTGPAGPTGPPGASGPWVDVMSYGAVADGSSHLLSASYANLTAAQVDYPQATALTDEKDLCAILQALAVAAGGSLSGTATRGVYLRGGTYMVNRMITAPHATVLHGDGPDLSIIKATSSFSFPDTNTAVLRSATGSATAAPSLRRLSLDGILIHGNSVTGANGILAGLQQPSLWNNWRVRDCPGYGVFLHGQQTVSINGEVTNCGTNMRLAGLEFGYFFGLNLEQAATTLLTFETFSLTAGQCVISGLHMEGLTPAGGYAVDVTNGFGLTFINPYFANLAGQHFFKFSGTKASYKIINARNATSSSSSEFVNDGVNTAIGTVLASSLNPDREAVDFSGGVPIMAASGIRVGTQGSTISNVIRATASFNPPSMAAGAAEQTTVTVTGARKGDPVIVGANFGTGKWLVTGQVSSTDNVTITVFNGTGSSGTPGGSGTTYEISVFKVIP